MLDLLLTEDTNGTGVILFSSSSSVSRVMAKNSDGSGLAGSNCDNARFYDIYSNVSGYSGISINGQDCFADTLHSVSSSSGYGGINIGHNSENSKADGTVVSNFKSEGALGGA